MKKNQSLKHNYESQNRSKVNEKFNILYIHSFSFWRKSSIMQIFYRISNYLNSKKDELNGIIKEELLDLEYEPLPEFELDNIGIYRCALKQLLVKVYKRFKFNLVVISCYSSFSYINSVEVAFLIKTNFNCEIAVGGIHSTICPEDFQPGNFPKYIYDSYPTEYTPFDYLIQQEGEIPLFNLVRDLLNDNIKKRENLSEKCILLKPEILKNLDELPLIDLNFLKKYKDKLKTIDTIWIDFSRGCPFKCNFCLNSEDYFSCSKKVRLKSVEKCIDELKILNNTKWLNLKYVYISDLIFLPKKSVRKRFFESLTRVFKEEGGFTFTIWLEDRIDLYSTSDLENYKKFNIIPSYGLESCSKTLLYIMGKVLGKSTSEIWKGIDRYLMKFVNIIKEGNKLNLDIIFHYMVCVPGSSEITVKETYDFFFEKRFNGKSLAEKYKFTIKINKYMSYVGTMFYNNAEVQYGTKVYFKNWWKLFDRNQPYYASYLDPSKDFTYSDSLNYAKKFLKKIIKKQHKLGNPNYSTIELLKRKKEKERFRWNNPAELENSFLIPLKKLRTEINEI